MSAGIFISFASEDVKVANTLCAALESRGFKCWISSRDILAGENFQTSIVRAIRGAKMMLLVFTANSNASDEMSKELALASQYRLIVVPLRVEDVAPNDAFAYEFATRQWIDFYADWEAAINQLCVRIAHAMSAEASEAAVAEAAAAAAAPRSRAPRLDPPRASPTPAPPAAVETLSLGPTAPPKAEPEPKAPAEMAAQAEVKAPPVEPAPKPAPVAKAADIPPPPKPLPEPKVAAEAKASPPTTPKPAAPATAAKPPAASAAEPETPARSRAGLVAALGVAVVVLVGAGAVMGPKLMGRKPAPPGGVATAAPMPSTVAPVLERASTPAPVAAAPSAAAMPAAASAATTVAAQAQPAASSAEIASSSAPPAVKTVRHRVRLAASRTAPKTDLPY